MLKKLEMLLLCVVLHGWMVKMTAQSVVVLPECGVSYVDPQDEVNTPTQTRDTLRYREIFDAPDQLRSFNIDINAFGGQATDRARVFAILPDSSLLPLGSLAFGGCADCIDGFALVVDGVLQAQGVTDRPTMEMWLQSFNLPPYALPENLQTLSGVGRISGRLPFCAVGWQVDFIVSNSPANQSTEFSAHVHCPTPVAACAIVREARIDCQTDSIYLRAEAPVQCFAGPVDISWRTPSGRVLDAAEGAVPIDGNLGVFLLMIDDGACTLIDSVRVENPSFVDAGADLSICRGESAVLSGSGGSGNFWELPGGGRGEGAEFTLAAAAAGDAGDYIFHGFNADGCEDTDTLRLVVRAPAEPEIRVSDACLGDTLRLDVVNEAAYDALRWIDPRGQALVQTFIPDFQAPDAGRYKLVATGADGCTVQREVDVSAAEPPGVEVIVEEACDSTRLYLTPPLYDYRWSTGAAGNYFATAAGGRYTVTITDANGCSAVREIDAPQPEGPAFAVEITQPECPGDAGSIEIRLSGGERPAIFSIDGGAHYSLSPRFDNLPYGRFDVAVQDELGCVRHSTAQIVAPDTLGVALNYDRLDVRPTTPVTLRARTVGDVREYQWLPREIDTGTGQTEFIADRDLDVRIIVRDARGCIASAGFPLTIVLGTVYIPNAFSPNDDGANDRFTFYSDLGSGEVIESLRIFDRWGGLLFEANEIGLNDERSGWDGRTAGRPVGPGVMTYYGVVRFGNGVRKVYKGDVTLLR